MILKKIPKFGLLKKIIKETKIARFLYMPHIGSQKKMQ